MRYRNTKTGAVIRTTGKVVGEEWEPLDEETVEQTDSLSADGPPEKPAPKRKGKK